METAEVAEAFTALLKAGRFDEAAMRFWAQELATYEAAPGDFAEVHGRDAAFAKAKWWYENHDVHSTVVEGPWVNGNHFLCRMTIDVTPKGGQRRRMEEHVLYTVRDGRIVEERYFY